MGPAASLADFRAIRESRHTAGRQRPRHDPLPLRVARAASSGVSNSDLRFAKSQKSFHHSRALFGCRIAEVPTGLSHGQMVGADIRDESGAANLALEKVSAVGC